MVPLNAPGYVCGLGSVGPHLSAEGSDMGLFTSVDGGLTWNESLKGAYLYSSTPDGGLLLAASLNSKSSDVYVSINWGMNWTAVQFIAKDHAVYVVDIRPACIVLEPCTAFWITFRERKDPKFEITNRNMYVDIRNHLHIKNCTGLDQASVSLGTSDFEKFRPHEPGSDCRLYIISGFMGRAGYYIRKKRESSCFLNLVMPSEFQSENKCKCRLEDWECDFGYERVIGTDVCV